MRNRLITLFLIIFIFPISVFSLEYPRVNSKVIEIYDLTDKKVLYEVKASDEIYIASLTKIATTITAIENIKDLDEKVTITQNILNSVSKEASVAGLKVGDKVTYRDLLYASMVPSGADATNALAILLSGSIDNFVTKMNELVTRIGLEHTHFVNVTGLDVNNHYSTADDIRKLLEYALQNEVFKDVYTTKKYTLSNGLKVTTTLDLYGKNIDTTSILGSKSGHTKKAGYCLSSISNINGHEMLIILIQGEYKDNKFYNIVDTLDLINFMNNNYKDEVLVKKDEIVKKVKVELSNIDVYDIKATEDIKKYLPSDYDKDNFVLDYDGPELLDFRSDKGDKIGTMYYYYNKELIAKEDVILDTEISINIWKCLLKYHYVVIILVLIPLSIIVIKKHKKRIM